MRAHAPAFALVLLAALPAAHAEKADREKDIQILADSGTGDDGKGEIVYEGNVVITQGTLRVTAARVVLRQDGEGLKSMVATGTPVTFRQKRDKVDDWVEGEAKRAEFDERTELLKLLQGARLKSAQGEVTGEVITYDRGRDFFQVTGGKPVGDAAPSRVKATIVPQKKGAAPPKPDAPVDLKPDKGPGTGG